MSGAGGIPGVHAGEDVNDGPHQDMVSWLREQILARKAAAEAATKGLWEVTGQAGLGDAWQIHGGIDDDAGTTFDWSGDDPVEVPIRHRVATLSYEDGGGVWRREDADHIILNQPQDTIARCEYELAVIEEHMPVYAWRPGGCARCVTWPKPGIAEESFPCAALRRLAYAYRRRPGWSPEWAPELAVGVAAPCPASTETP